MPPSAAVFADATRRFDELRQAAPLRCFRQRSSLSLQPPARRRRRRVSPLRQAASLRHAALRFSPLRAAEFFSQYFAIDCFIDIDNIEDNMHFDI